MSLEIFLALCAFALVASATPGPNNLMIMASAANFGARRTLPHLLGVLIGFNLMLWLVGAGLMTLLVAYPASLVALKAASVIFLLYLAWKFATAAPSGDNHEAKAGKPLTFLQGAAFQWVNPKAWALSLAALGAYTNEAHPIASLAVIAIVFFAAGVPSVGSWLFLGGQIRRLLSNRSRLRIFNWSCAGLLTATLWPILSVA